MVACFVMVSLVMTEARAGTVVDATGQQVSATETTRLVTLGGGVTESVHALGAGDQIVGVDATSLYPPSVQHLPKVGYFRQLSSEGLLAMRPELIVATTAAGPPEVLDQVRAAGIPVALLPDEGSVDGASRRLRMLGGLLDEAERAEALIESIEESVAAVKPRRERPEVLFIYARGAGTVQVAGSETTGSEMIRLAGGTNAVTTWTGYKPLTAEGIIAANPDVILLTERGLASIGGLQGVLQQPGVALTEAGKRQRVVSLDDLLLLGFGPRTGEAVAALADALKP
ncbi:MAG: ABC transporter substrate-binding protein [Myxococcales bacterium]|nr:ABC transporter substrate-binding protein [Myxococcales bacterium]